MKLYHVTAASRLPSIERKGLSPELAGRWIYLAVDAMQAAGYEAFFPRQQVVLLEVDVSKLDKKLLGPDDQDLPDLMDQAGDERDWRDVSWKESLRISGQATYDGTVPPEAITVVRVWRSLRFRGMGIR